MSGRSPAGPLMHEHRVIERMIAVLGAELDNLRATGHADPSVMSIAVDFIRTYADRCHHGKEEDILFRRLEPKPLDAEVAAMMEELIADHVFARRVTGHLAEASARYAKGDETALVEIESALASLVDLYPVHIGKEDKHFFKPCLEYFTDAEKSQMLVDFDEFDRALIHEKYAGVVEGLERRG